MFRRLYGLRVHSPTLRSPSLLREASSMSSSDRRMFKPKPVEQLSHDALTPSRLRSILQESPPRPVHVVPSLTKPPPAVDIVQMLLEDPASERCIVDLEIGRYDQQGFEKAQLPLTTYLSWLRNGKEGGKMGGKQVYLAQWRGLEDIPSLQQVLAPPAALQDLLSQGLADLYQASFFVGAGGATTPLHYDPYINLFSLASCSDRTACKHFLILPPTSGVSAVVKRAESEASHLRNTSPLEFVVRGDEWALSSTSPAQSHAELLSKEAFGVRLRAGELLLLPERWWHRVENFGEGPSWTAGVGYWFKTR